MTTSSSTPTNADFTHAVNLKAAEQGLTPEVCLHIMAFDFDRVILDRPKLKRLQERYAAGLPSSSSNTQPPKVRRLERRS